MSDYPAVAVLGPTGSGKTALGMALAERFHGEIVVCDALQVYLHMDIGTAKPAADDRQRIPHHMLDLRKPCDDFNAGEYMRLGRSALDGIRARGRIPFVVGGTGFYFRALTDGLFEGPGRSEALRSRMRRIVAIRGAACIHAALTRADPETARRLAPLDAERNIRAYEVFLLTGQTMGWWQNRPRNALSGYRWRKIGIHWSRPELYARVDTRVEEMFTAGLVLEVEYLMQSYPRDCHAFKAIGYRQVRDHLEGKLSQAQAVEEIQRESRRYAKRQLTWFRADAEIEWLEASSGPAALLEQASLSVVRFLEENGGAPPRTTKPEPHQPL
jgi:tRNA dimethylallyltransferase